MERRDAQVERQVEVAALAGEVLVELPPHLVDPRAQHANAEDAGELLLALPHFAEVDGAEASRSGLGCDQ